MRLFGIFAAVIADHPRFMRLSKQSILMFLSLILYSTFILYAVNDFVYYDTEEGWDQDISLVDSF